MAETSFSKLELAQRQLETAIGLFISRRDRISAITLAGAADGILHGLVLKAKKQPFADYAMGVYEALSSETPARAKYARHINDTLKINDLKHMDEDDSDNVAFDPDLSALGAILKAITNHKILVPENPPYITAMLQWSWMFYDGTRIKEDEPYQEPAGKELIAWYQERPEKVKKMEARLAKKLQSLAPEKKKK